MPRRSARLARLILTPTPTTPPSAPQTNLPLPPPPTRPRQQTRPTITLSLSRRAPPPLPELRRSARIRARTARASGAAKRIANTKVKVLRSGMGGLRTAGEIWKERFGG